MTSSVPFLGVMGGQVSVTALNVKNAASTSFSVSLTVKNAAGTSFTVTNSVKNAAGTPFTVI